MSTFPWSVVYVVALGVPMLFTSPAQGDPPSKKPAATKLRLVVQAEGPPRTYDVIVAAERCATARSKVVDREDDITVCAQREDERFDINWWTRQATREYRSTGSLVLARGATAELGSAEGPRLSVTAQ